MRKTARSTVALAAIAILTTIAASCSSDDGDDTGGLTATGPGVTVRMKDIAFDPTTLTLTAGQDTTLQLVNGDGVEHSFTLDDDSVSQDVEGGESSSITINVTGTVGWHCKYHPDTMKGIIEVG